jgi:hypothetical protein
MDGLIHGEHVTPGFRVGVFGPDSVHLAGPRGVDVPARRSVLGRRSVTQGRMPVAVAVLVFEVADNHPASNRLFQWLRLRHSLRSRLLNDSM